MSIPPNCLRPSETLFEHEKLELKHFAYQGKQYTYEDCLINVKCHHALLFALFSSCTNNWINEIVIVNVQIYAGNLSFRSLFYDASTFLVYDNFGTFEIFLVNHTTMI